MIHKVQKGPTLVRRAVPHIFFVALFSLGLQACDDEDDPVAEDVATDAEADAGDLDAGSDSADLEVGDADPVDSSADAVQDVTPDVIPLPPGVEVEIEESQGARDRRAEYLEFCGAGNGPGQGSVYGQACRLAVGENTFNEDQITSALAKLEERRDTADFSANGLVRLLYVDDETGGLPDELREQIDQTLLDFKYWIDEPGQDGMAYWTENHQILFHTVELLMGQRHLETEFSNSGMTGAEHVEHALPRIERWLDLRGLYGFSEWHSNVYYNEDIPALVNLVDFAEDEMIRRKATLILDLIALDLLTNVYSGAMATTHGRTYQSKYINGANDSTREAAWLMLGIGEYQSAGNFGGSFLATSEYFAPQILEDLAIAVADDHVSRQRDSITIEEGPSIGISYEGLDDTVVWAGLSAIVAPDVIDGAMAVVEDYNLWDGFLFGNLPDSLTDILRTMQGTPGLRTLAEDLEPISRGIALEAVDTYVYRTPDYQLAGAQDYKPGSWQAQSLMWRAALDTEAFVLTTSPALLGIGDLSDVTVDDPWIGGWLPRVTMERNVGIIQYRRVEGSDQVDALVSDTYVHAYFPKLAFDEVVEQSGWYIGRKGDGYLALWSDETLTWSEENDYELVFDGRANTFVVELGSASDNGTFSEFVDAVSGSSIAVNDDTVAYTSPSLGEIEVGWTGPMTIDGEPVDIGPYDRWDNEHAQQRRGTPILDVTLQNLTIRYDFESGSRTLYDND